MTIQNDPYQKFIAWQCRVRKQSMRELGGKRTSGMSAGVYSVKGGDEQTRMNFLLVKEDSENLTSDFRHIVRKSQDPADRVKNGLKILCEWHYQQNTDFSRQLTALFYLDSNLAEALAKAGECHLKFAQDSVEFAFDFDVVEFDESDSAYQSTFWHNHVFNPSMPGKVRVFGFTPRVSEQPASS
ncbi:MAG: hypothetical protein ACI8XC_004547 [Gammaproteobacteria bacterium]|jgi:hypothetical protein